MLGDYMFSSFCSKTLLVIAIGIIFGVGNAYAKFNIDSLKFSDARIEALEDFNGDYYKDTLVSIQSNGFNYPYYIAWYNVGYQKRTYFKFNNYDRFTISINCTNLNTDNLKDMLFSVTTFKKNNSGKFITDSIYHTIVFGQSSLKNQDSILIKAVKTIDYSPIVQMNLDLVLESKMKTDFSNNNSFYINKASNIPLIKENTDVNADIVTSLGLYPNPSVNTITLELKNLASEQYRYIVTNPLGVIIKDEKIANGIKNYSTELSTEILASGAYYVTIYENEKILLMKSFMVSK